MIEVPRAALTADQVAVEADQSARRLLTDVTHADEPDRLARQGVRAQACVEAPRVPRTRVGVKLRGGVLPSL